MKDDKYYTPKHIVEYIDLATGTGEFLKNAADSVIGNPPFAFQHRVQ